MTEERGGLMRRAYSALASCYAVACCLPAGLAHMMNGSEPGSTPGYSYVDGRQEGCGGHFGCPSEPADVGGLLQVTGVVLALSLLVAVPLCRYLARKWQMPILAGFIAAIIGWAALCVGGLLFLVA